MSAGELRPMGVGDILDTTFRLYRQRFLTFLLIALAVYLPYAILVSLLESATPAVVVQAGPAAQPQFSAQAFGLRMVAMGLFWIILIPLSTAALIQNISASYLGERLSAGDSYARAMPRLLPMLGTQILVTLAVAIGFCLFVVPGIIFSLWFFVAIPVVILETKGGFRAMGRSRQLMKGNLDKALKLALALFLLSFIFGMVMNLLLRFVPWPHPALATFVASILPVLWLPIQTAPGILLYYDLRIRKEAFDLEQLSAMLNQPAPAAT
jgi:magnesium-transporting ATPase (P-type)